MQNWRERKQTISKDIKFTRQTRIEIKKRIYHSQKAKKYQFAKVRNRLVTYKSGLELISDFVTSYLNSLSLFFASQCAPNVRRVVEMNNT